MAQEGKTTRALELVRAESARAICLDVVRSKALADVALSWGSCHELAQFLVSPEAGGRWCGAMRSREFADYVWILRAAPYLRHCTLLIDEALTFATAPESIEPMIRLARMNAHYGGGIGVPVILTAQRPLDLPPDVRSQITRIISFRQREPRDLQWIGAYASPDFAAQVFALEPHHCLVFPPSVTPSVTSEEEHDERRISGRRRGGSRVAGAVPTVPAGEFHREDQAPHQVTDAGARQEA